MNYTIRSGDTLSGLAARFNTSVGALMKANPSIRNANLIFTGRTLNVPGSRDEFVGARAKPKPAAKPAAKPKPATTNTVKAGPSASGGSSAAYNVARSVLGRNISNLKYSGPLAQYLDKWPGNNVCCANFVSAALEKAGQIRHSEHNDNVSGLAKNLATDPRWAKSSLKNAKPGDVVCFAVPGEGHMSHVVLFAGWKNGVPNFIGSNNANPDGSQRITQGYMNYPVDAVYHFKG